MGFHRYKGHKSRHIRNGVRVRAVPPDEHSTTTAFGVDFPRGYWVNTEGLPEAHQTKLTNNPGFDFAEKAPRGEPVVQKPDIGPLHRLSDPGDDSHLYTDVDDEAPVAEEVSEEA